MMLCYVSDEAGARASFKKYLEKYSPVAVLTFHSNPWVGEEVINLIKKL
jgi:hypothetical protein